MAALAGAARCCALFLLLACGPAFATGVVGAREAARVQFAGVAYTGAAAAAATSMPYVHAAIEREGIAAINRGLVAAIAGRPPMHFRVQTDLATLGGGDAIVLAAAIDRETVVVERIADKYKLLFEVAAQALFFDFRERQVRFSVPLTLQYIELFPQPPRPEQIQAVADRLLSAKAGREGLALALAESLLSVNLPSESSRRLQLTDISVAASAAARLGDTAIDQDVLGHEFSKMVSANLGLPLLPFARGHAVGGVMPTRFADGSIFNLTIPEPDYQIQVEVSDFREKTLQQTPAYHQQLYGAYFRVRVEEPLSGKVYFDQPLRQGATRTIPQTQAEANAFAAYYETLLAGFGSLADAIASRDSAWAQEQTGGREFTQQLKSLKELVATCR